MKKLTVLFTVILITITVFSQSKKVAITPVFDREQNVANMYKLMVRISLTKAIANHPNYIALDRNNVDKIIDEVNFQNSGIVTEAEIKELGNMLGADYVCILEVASDNNQIVISASILEIETGIAVPGKNDFVVSDLDNYKIEQACKDLVNKLFVSNKIYLDANWQPLPNATGAEYYRIVDFINQTNRAQVRDYYINEQVQMTGEGIFNDKTNLADYIMDGEFTFFDENGNTIFIRNYKNGKLEGKIVAFYENGNYKLIAYCVNDKFNGKYQEFHDNGKLHIDTYMISDILSGNYKQWYSNGLIYRDGSVSYGDLNGDYKTYYDNGRLNITGTLKNGLFNGYTKVYYENGLIQFEGYMENGYAEGSGKIYYQNGTVLTLNFDNGVANYNGQPVEMRILKVNIYRIFELN